MNHLVRRVVGRVRRLLGDVEVSTGENPSVQLLHGVKLYREVHVGGTVFRGTADTPGRTIRYVFDLLPDDAIAGRTVLDLGTAGGAVCFEAAGRGARSAVGVETEGRRIRGARFIRRRTREKKVTFVHQDFWEFFQQTRPHFDVIFALNVLHHFANPLPLLRRVAQAAGERIVVEVPTAIAAEDYNEYGDGLSNLTREGPIKSAEDITRFLALYDFALEQHRPSPQETQFCGSDEVPRAVFVYKRLPESRVKSREERRLEVEQFREARSLSWRQARADQFNIDCQPEEPLGEILSRALGDRWTDAAVNVILCGPAASGKSHLFETAGVGTHPQYHYKTFKFPNDKNQQGLRQHLSPRPGQGGKIAQVLLSSVDDPHAHCTVHDLARQVTGRPVVCLLLNVSFSEHFERLYRRQADRAGTPDGRVDYEVPLQFDCKHMVDRLRAHGCQYRVLTFGAAA